MKVDFQHAELQFMVEGDNEQMDLRKPIGNLIFGRSSDIALSDFGKKIYYSEGEIDVPDEFNAPIQALVNESNFSAPVKRAIDSLFSKPQNSKTDGNAE